MGFHIVNGITSLHVKSDCLARKCLDEDLHATTKTQDQVESRFFLNVVIGQGASVLQLLTCEDQALLIWWNAFLILNLGFHIVNGRGKVIVSGTCENRSRQ